MTWILLSLLSAGLLGCYDIAKKISVKDNAVPAVLLASVTVGALVWLPMLIWSVLAPESQPIDLIAIRPMTWREHALVAFKSALVASSWTFSFFALKHLPLSIAAPIRSTSPLWTIVIATVWFNERPNVWQWVGMTVVLVAFWAFSLVGRREGIRFSGNRWVACMVLATITGAISAIYDKYLLQTERIPIATLQAWFTIDLVPAMLPAFAWWYRFDRHRNPFQWRRSVAWISPLLLITDFAYFAAVSDERALISVISTLRRCSVIVAFLFGVRALGEKQFFAKAWCVAGILMGAVILSLLG